MVFAGGRLGPDGPRTLLKQFPIEKDIKVTKNKLKKTSSTDGKPSRTQQQDPGTDGLIN